MLSELGDELGLTAKKHVDRSLSKAKVRADKALAKARTRDSMQALDKLTQVVDGEARFVSDPPLLVPDRGASLRGPERPSDRTDARASSQLPATPCRAIAGTCSISSGSSVSPARWSGWAASGPGPGSS